MTQKTVGYVKLEWTCPNCSTKNPGPQKTCTSCGLPQPDNVTFQQPVQTELITDEATIAQAKAGPDVHCYYCGTRNPATAKTCSQCGADLTQAAARAAGQVLGAHHTGPVEPVTCPACGASNEPNAAKCVQCGASLAQPKPQPALAATASPSARSGGFSLPLILGGAVLLVLIGACIFFVVLATRTTDVSGTVDGVEWSRTIFIEQLTPVSGQAWRDQIPAGATVGNCREEQRGSESRPSGETREVCGTPYTKDTGTGVGEVVQDCETEPIYEEVPVYDAMCSYTATVWQRVDDVTLTGADLNPRWPEASITGRDRREGGREEQYEIIFDADGKTYTYTTSEASEFQKFQPGSRWVLNVNSFDAVTAVEPVKEQ